MARAGGWEGKTALELAESQGKHAAASVLQAWAAGTRDAAELDRLVAQAPADQGDSTDEDQFNKYSTFGGDDY